MIKPRKRGNYYEIRVEIGKDSKGKRIYITEKYYPENEKFNKKSYKEAEKRTMLLEERYRNKELSNCKIKFEDYAEIYLTEYANLNVKKTTYTSYVNMMDRINAAFGNMSLCDIRPSHIMRFYKNLTEKGIRQDVKYNANTQVSKLIKGISESRAKLAKRVGVAESVIRSCARGENITYKSAEKVADYFGKKVEDLFDRCEDKGLSQKSIRNYANLLSVMLETAVQLQYIEANPCDRVKKPRFESKEVESLNEEQLSALFKALDEDPTVPYEYGVMIKILLLTGLRRGELLGLEWGDIDFERGHLRVVRASLYDAEQGIYTDTPKSKRSKRRLKLSNPALKLFYDYREWQQHRIEELGSAWHKTDRIFTGWDGQLLHPSTLGHWFSDFLKRNGLDHTHLHALRHTNATFMIARGTAISAVSSRLGHANVATTLAIYVHALESADEEAAEIIEDAFGPMMETKKKKYS